MCGLLEFRVREFWAETASPTPSSGKVEALRFRSSGWDLQFRLQSSEVWGFLYSQAG